MTPPPEAPKVVNLRVGQRVSDDNVVIVDRRTMYGNPYHIGPDGDRVEVIAKFREWIWRPGNEELRKEIRLNLRGKDLACWCAPLPCHADLLLEIANAD